MVKKTIPDFYETKNIEYNFTEENIKKILKEEGKKDYSLTINEIYNEFLNRGLPGIITDARPGRNLISLVIKGKMATIGKHSHSGDLKRHYIQIVGPKTEIEPVKIALGNFVRNLSKKKYSA